MALNPFAARRRRREAELAEHDAFVARRAYLREDVTVFGEELGQLHLDTLTDTLAPDDVDRYHWALESYERSTTLLEAATTDDDLVGVHTALVQGRHQRACVLAAVAGEPLPAEHEECFSNPQHGPSTTEVSWAPPGGVARQVPVCAADARRLAQGEDPDTRMVRVGDRYVPLTLVRNGAGDRFPTYDDRAWRYGQTAAARLAVEQGEVFPPWWSTRRPGLSSGAAGARPRRSSR